MDRHQLELVDQGAEGLLHVLDGQPVSPGDLLEVQTADGWLSGQYHWTCERGRWPQLFYDRGRWVDLCPGDAVRRPG